MRVGAEHRDGGTVAGGWAVAVPAASGSVRPGWASWARGWISWPKTVLTQSRTGGTVRKLVVSATRLAERALRRRGTWRCRPAGSGRSTASGRRPRTAARRAPSTSRQSRRVARRAAGDPDRELDLDRVGVLELVEQQPLVPVAAAPPGRRRGGAAGRGPAPAGRGTPAGRRRRRSSADSSTVSPTQCADAAQAAVEDLRRPARRPASASAAQSRADLASTSGQLRLAAQLPNCQRARPLDSSASRVSGSARRLQLRRSRGSRVELRQQLVRRVACSRRSSAAIRAASATSASRSGIVDRRPAARRAPVRRSGPSRRRTAGPATAGA